MYACTCVCVHCVYVCMCTCTFNVYARSRRTCTLQPLARSVDRLVDRSLVCLIGSTSSIVSSLDRLIVPSIAASIVRHAPWSIACSSCFLVSLSVGRSRSFAQSRNRSIHRLHDRTVGHPLARLGARLLDRPAGRSTNRSSTRPLMYESGMMDAWSMHTLHNVAEPSAPWASCQTWHELPFIHYDKHRRNHLLRLLRLILT